MSSAPTHTSVGCPIGDTHFAIQYYSGLPLITGYRKREIQAVVEDHLKQLITQHFDPKKADLIFTEEGSVSLCTVL